MNKIALIIPYFGRFNNYFHLWLESAINNSKVDFLIYTDQKIESKNNVFVYNITLPQISELILEKLTHALADNNIAMTNCKLEGGG